VDEYPGCVLVIDSTTPEWSGRNGILDTVDRFGDWKSATPRHRAFIEGLASLPCHLIVTVRAKMKYEVTTGANDKQRITKLGVGPEQRDNFLYEFDIVGDIDLDSHEATFSNRCDVLVGKTMNLVPGDEIAKTITSWLSEGEAPPPPPEAATDLDIENLRGLLIDEGFAEDLIAQRFDEHRRRNHGVMTVDYVTEQTLNSLKRQEERLALGEAAVIAELEKVAVAAEVPEEIDRGEGL
jgi:hypothetical protein